MSSFVIWTYHHDRQTQVGVDAIERARAISSAVDREYGRLEAGLLALAVSPLLATDDLAGFHANLQAALQNFDASAILLVAPSGHVLLSTDRPFGAPIPEFGNSAFHQQILATGEAAMSDLYTGTTTRLPIYAVSVPIKRDGAVVYTLTANVRPDQLADLLAEQRLPDSWRGVIADSSGTIVARTHEISRFLGAKVVPAMLNELSLSDEAVFESPVLEGTPSLIAYSRSMRTRWTVGISAPETELTAGIRQTLIQVMALSGIGVVIALALAFYFGGRIAGAFHALIQPAKDLGDGKKVNITPMTINEANEVGEALIKAAKLVNQAKRAKADFLAGMSHELRTPLNAILGFAQLMESDSPTPAQKRMLDYILAAGWSLLELVDELLKFAEKISFETEHSPEAGSLTDPESESLHKVE